MPDKHKKHKKHSQHDCDKKRNRHSPTLFANDEHREQINVNVTVNEKQDDCLTGCFKSCFSIGKKAAT